jgi:hypothetical protein
MFDLMENIFRIDITHRMREREQQSKRDAERSSCLNSFESDHVRMSEEDLGR